MDGVNGGSVAGEGITTDLVRGLHHPQLEVATAIIVAVIVVLLLTVAVVVSSVVAFIVFLLLDLADILQSFKFVPAEEEWVGPLSPDIEIQ